MSKSYDLSTSTKWANLADGDHVVKLKSKGAGYGTSSFSNSVTVTKGTAAKSLEAGKYKWADILTIPSEGLYFEQLLNFSYVINGETINASGYQISELVLEILIDGEWSYCYDGEWSDVALQLITVATDQTVSADFYNWAIIGGNLNKVHQSSGGNNP